MAEDDAVDSIDKIRSYKKSHRDESSWNKPSTKDKESHRHSETFKITVSSSVCKKESHKQEETRSRDKHQECSEIDKSSRKSANLNTKMLIMNHLSKNKDSNFRKDSTSTSKTSKSSSQKSSVIEQEPVKSSSTKKHHHHHHHHHRSHDRHKKDSDQSSNVKSKGSLSSDALKKESHLSSKKHELQIYPVIKSLDSKEIYADGMHDAHFCLLFNFAFFLVGDKIMINVNFRKEPTPPEKSTEDTKSKNESCSKNASTDSNVDILSPQSNNDDAFSSPLYDASDEVKRGKRLFDSYVKNKTEKESNRFVPRNVQSKQEVSISNHGPTSPDSLLPPKEQLMSSHKHDQSKDDFYDPELPLQSPDRYSLQSSSSAKSPPLSKNDRMVVLMNFFLFQ